MVTTTQESATKREIEDVMKELMSCVRRKDAERLEELHLYGPKFTKFDDFEPLDRQDADTCRTSEREGLLGVDSAEFGFRDLKVDVFDDVAIATFLLDERLTAGGEHISTTARSTIIFVREDGWKITHEHFSALKSNP